MKGIKYGDNFQERQPQISQKRQSTWVAIKYIHKLFTKITATRLDGKLDENQPREEAGFRSKYAYSPTDHIHDMCIIVYSNHDPNTLRFAYVLERIRSN